MDLEEAKRLVALLRSGLLRTRTGILLLVPQLLGEEREAAARLDVDAVDYADTLLRSAAPSAAALRIGADREARRLAAIADLAQGDDAVLVANFDLALSGMSSDEREGLWRDLFALFARRRRALLLAVPKSAADLLPLGAALEDWQRGGRVAIAGKRER
jgi:hypothetical protein